MELIELIKNILNFFRTKDKVLNECIKNNILIYDYKEITIFYHKNEHIHEKCFKIDNNLWCFYLKETDKFFILKKYQLKYLLLNNSECYEEFYKIINEYKINKKFFNKIKNYFFKFKNNIK